MSNLPRRMLKLVSDTGARELDADNRKKDHIKNCINKLSSAITHTLSKVNPGPSLTISSAASVALRQLGTTHGFVMLKQLQVSWSCVTWRITGTSLAHPSHHVVKCDACMSLRSARLADSCSSSSRTCASTAAGVQLLVEWGGCSTQMLPTNGSV
jgi:hypothetical protein